MENLLFLTLQYHDGSVYEQIAKVNKYEKAAESMVADTKYRLPEKLYINEVVESIAGLLVKGSFKEEYDIKKWL